MGDQSFRRLRLSKLSIPEKKVDDGSAEREMALGDEPKQEGRT